VYRIELGLTGADVVRDRLLVTTQFEHYAPIAARRAALSGPDALQSLAAALAGWQRSAAAVMKTIEDARTTAPGAGHAVFPAYRYLSRIAAQVGAALASHLGGPSLASAADATDDVTFSTRPNPPAQIATSGRMYQLEGSGSVRNLSVGATRQGLDRLKVLEWSAATANLRIDRNAELLPGFPSDDRFVYTTERVAAGDWARPHLDPETLFVAATVPATGAARISALRSRIESWLGELTHGHTLDLTVRASYAFEPTGIAPTTMADLASFTFVPICFVPGVLVGTDVEVARLATDISALIDAQLPLSVAAPNAGVQLEINVFTHASAGISGTLAAERGVLTLRGLWIPFATQDAKRKDSHAYARERAND
jgi:hypothetical protein